MSASIHIGIIEDNKYIRAAWESVLTSESGFEITGSFSNCEDAFRSEDFLRSDLYLMDISLPGMTGIEGVKHIRRRNPAAVVVMCTVHDDDQTLYEALCAGAVGYLLKKTPPAELIAALQDAAQGGSPMTPTIARKVITSFHTHSKNAAHDEELSEKEKEVLTLMAQGKSYTAIARELFLSVDGVRYHIRHVYEKLQVHSRGEAVASGLKRKLIHLSER
jgi:DNA-binding NarL/FixJ family response regulator